MISAAIDKYVYITLHETFSQELIIKYSKMELVETVDEVKHPIVREALRLVGVGPQPHLEIVSMSDIPAGTGLGSSGSFTVALLRALHAWKKNLVPRQELAEQACHIEIDLLGEPIGKQDQYIAAFGGITCFQFLPDGAWTWRRCNSPRDAGTTWKTTCCCSSPASRAPRRRSSKNRTRARASTMPI